MLFTMPQKYLLKKKVGKWFDPKKRKKCYHSSVDPMRRNTLLVFILSPMMGGSADKATCKGRRVGSTRTALLVYNNQ